MTTKVPSFCGGCGNAFGEDSRFCENCGLPRTEIPASSRSAPSLRPQLTRTDSVESVRKWYRRDPFPIVLCVASFFAAYAFTSLPTERVRMPVILTPLYYGLGHEIFFGLMSAILGGIIWASIKYVD